MIKNKMTERQKIKFLLETLSELIKAWNQYEDVSKQNDEYLIFRVKQSIQASINKYMNFMQSEFKEEKGEENNA